MVLQEIKPPIEVVVVVINGEHHVHVLENICDHGLCLDRSFCNCCLASHGEKLLGPQEHCCWMAVLIVVELQSLWEVA